MMIPVDDVVVVSFCWFDEEGQNLNPHFGRKIAKFFDKIIYLARRSKVKF